MNDTFVIRYHGPDQEEPMYALDCRYGISTAAPALDAEKATTFETFSEAWNTAWKIKTLSGGAFEGARLSVGEKS